MSKAKRKICVVTGSRAEYGLLKPLILEMRRDPCWEVFVIVTGSHLSTKYGLTVREILRDGFPVYRKVVILSNGSNDAARAMGKAVVGLSNAYRALNPDIIVVLGDRYEILAAVSAALLVKIPVAHIAGGDITEGAFDDAIRHAVTKMSHLHFPTNGRSARLIRQLGEDPKRIITVGHLGIDAIRNLPMLSKAEIEKVTGIRLCSKILLVTFHPVTLNPVSSVRQLDQLLLALEGFCEETSVIFTSPNADPEGLELIRKIRAFVGRHANASFVPSMGQLLYLSLMRISDAVVGNSSSGIYEAPFLRVPTVNIGNRQKGRIMASSVINCEPSATAIKRAIRRALAMTVGRVKSPYGGGDAAARIRKALNAVKDFHGLVRKKFREVPV